MLELFFRIVFRSQDKEYMELKIQILLLLLLIYLFVYVTQAGLKLEVILLPPLPEYIGMYYHI